jgi:hypothetical protein
MFLRGITLPGQSRFIDEKILGFEQHSIAGNRISRSQYEYIAGDDTLVGYFYFVAIPEDRRLGLDDR